MSEVIFMKYGQRILKKAKEEMSKGLTDAQLSKALGIGKSTINEWKHKYPDFANVLRVARDNAILNVENALYNRAVGMKVGEIQTVSQKEGKSKSVKEVKEIQKELPPDVAACSLFLRNKAPDEWRDRREDLIAMVSKEDLKKSAEEINRIINSLG